MASRIESSARRTCVAFAAVLAGVTSFATPTRARAEPTATDRALAQSLFDEARELMKHQSYKEACPKLAESQRVDPGGGTLLNLALCHEHEGKTASAWSEFNEALSIAIRDGRRERERLAREHIEKLQPILSTITVTVDPAAEVTGFEVRLDGVVLRKAGWGSTTPLDPGAHRVEASAPERRAWSAVIDVREPGSREIVSVPPLEAEPNGAGSDAPQDPPAPASSGTTASRPPSGAVRAEPTGSARRATGLVIGGIGVVGFAVGAIFGLQAISKRTQSDRECVPEGCTPGGLVANDDARRDAWISNVGIGIGIVGVGVGTILLLTARSASSSPPAPAPVRVRIRPLSSGAPGVSAQVTF